MSKIDEELVERVALLIADNRARCVRSWIDDEPSSDFIDPVEDSDRECACAAIAALSTPEFVLPLAEEMLRAIGTQEVAFHKYPTETGVGYAGSNGMTVEDTLLGAYRAAKGERWTIKHPLPTHYRYASRSPSAELQSPATSALTLS
jgi:hypothetical protein